MDSGGGRMQARWRKWIPWTTGEGDRLGAGARDRIYRKETDMNYYHSRHLMLFGFLLFLPCASSAQWYQGPSGGRGGKLFDDWKATNGASDILAFGVYQDSSIRCIMISYRVASQPNGFLQQRHGYCD